MSTSLLYHGFGIQGYQHVHTKYHDGAIHYRVRQEVFSLRCPECGSYQVKRRGLVMRRFRTLPIGSKPVWIELASSGSCVCFVGFCVRSRSILPPGDGAIPGPSSAMPWNCRDT